MGKEGPAAWQRSNGKVRGADQLTKGGYQARDT